MKAAVQSKPILLLAVVLVIVAAMVVFYIRQPVVRAPQGGGPPSNSATNTATNGDEPGNHTPAGNNQTPPDNNTNGTPSVNNDTPPANTLPATHDTCDGNTITGESFTLALPAYVYGTAFDASNKTNPALKYESGEYIIYKCFNGIANITRTLGVPGGWIDPKNPYQAPVEPVSPPYAPPVNPPPAMNVMSIDNTTVNWSHEYPSAFVNDYNGFWNITPGNLYLTFDCGYDYNNLAASILDTLQARGVKAVFFVTGQFMNERPDLVRRMVSEGHVVGNHSYAHLNQPENLISSTDTVVADIRAWEQKYRDITGSNPAAAYFRPPGGAVSRRSMALMDQLGYKTLLWGAAYKDWDTAAQPSQADAMTLLRRYTTNGDIVLLHGVSQTSSDILGEYVDEYRGKGYVFSLP